MHLQSQQADFLRRLLKHGPGPHVQRALRKFHPAELAELLTELPVPDRRRMVDALAEARLASQTLRELPEGLLASVLADLSTQRLGTVLARLARDDAGYFLQLLDADRREEVLALLPQDKLAAVRRFLEWPEGSAARLATDRYLTVSIDSTIGEAIEGLRQSGDRADHSLFYLYVVDGMNRLHGVLPLRPLLTREPGTRVRDVMREDPVRVRADATEEEAAEVLTDYELLAVPVVDADDRLLGVITVDDVIDVIAEDAAEDVVRLAGVGEGDRPLGKVRESVRRRLPWMMVNLGTAFLAASVVALFEGSIARVAVLASFMPVVAGLGGNTGTQSLAVMTRGLALGEVPAQEARKAVLKEVGVGVSMGLTVGTFTALIAWLWKGNPWLGGVLMLAMVTNLTMAGLAGAAIPLLVRSLGGDPAVGGGVLLTAVTDIFGFLAFLGLATVFLPRLLG
ncbi:magnesium transporter [Myxococcota bacterium]|nr:magnesium transporter [Myxococcota bacterium]